MIIWKPAYKGTQFWNCEHSNHPYRPTPLKNAFPYNCVTSRCFLGKQLTHFSPLRALLACLSSEWLSKRTICLQPCSLEKLAYEFPSPEKNSLTVTTIEHTFRTLELHDYMVANLVPISKAKALGTSLYGRHIWNNSIRIIFTKNWDWALVFACSSASLEKVRYENIIGKNKRKKKIFGPFRSLDNTKEL